MILLNVFAFSYFGTVLRSTLRPTQKQSTVRIDAGVSLEVGDRVTHGFTLCLMPSCLSLHYAIRVATVKDAGQIAAHRAMMFRDMDLLSEPEVALLRDPSEAWLAEILGDGSYVGWMVQHGDDVIGGGGLHLRTRGPLPGSFEAGIAAHIANVYIESSHRRRGLAEALMTTMLDWSRSRNVKELTLTASEQGNSLYRRLGFLPHATFYTMNL